MAAQQSTRKERPSSNGGPVSRIQRLALLAPNLLEAILGGWADQRVMLERLERPLPGGWEERRERIIS